MPDGDFCFILKNAMKTLRELWPGGPVYRGDAVSADSLALADFAGGAGAAAGCDLGCGSGLLMLLLCHGRPSLRMTGVELREEAAAECRENLLANGLGERCRVIRGDLRELSLPAGEMDLVIANPPYFPAGAGAASPDAGRELMRRESATLDELCAAAARLLRVGGRFCLVHRTERMPEVFAALAAAGLAPKRLRLMAARMGSAPELFLCEGRKGARPGLRTEPTLFQFGPDGAETAEYRRITHWEA